MSIQRVDDNKVMYLCNSFWTLILGQSNRIKQEFINRIFDCVCFFQKIQKFEFTQYFNFSAFSHVNTPTVFLSQRQPSRKSVSRAVCSVGLLSVPWDRTPWSTRPTWHAFPTTHVVPVPTHRGRPMTLPTMPSRWVYLHNVLSNYGSSIK